MAAKKQYGLIIPSKSKKTIEKSSVFDNSDEETLDPEQKLDSWKSKVKKKTHMEIQKILDEDPTVYEYDSIYDDMKSQKAEKKEIITKDRKPKYIGSLMKAADLRKKEYERRIERQIQKEREEEGDEFEDKEAFVTSSYKKKLLEKEEEEERERRQKELEERMDVTKQQDLSGFYRHFLNQTTGEEKIPGIESKNESTEGLAEKSEEIEDDKQSLELKRAKEAILKLKRNKKNSNSSSSNSSSESNGSSESSEDEDNRRKKEQRRNHSKRKSQSRRHDSDSDRERHSRKKPKYSHKDSKHRRRRSSSPEEESYRKKERRRSDEKRGDDHHHRKKSKSSHSGSSHKKKSSKYNKRRDYSSDSDK